MSQPGGRRRRPLYPMAWGAGTKAFEATYKCFSVAAAGREDLENGDKILMPEKAFREVSRLRLQFPLTMMAKNARKSGPPPQAIDRGGRRGTRGSRLNTKKSSEPFLQYCGVLEFSSPDGVCHLPHWMMQSLNLREGGRVTLRSAKPLPKGESAKFQPHTEEFLDFAMALGVRNVLELAMQHYSALAVGQTVLIQYGNDKYMLDVVEVSPGSAISLYGTVDLKVEFAPVAGSAETDNTENITPPRKGSETMDSQPASPTSPRGGTTQRVRGPTTPANKKNNRARPRPGLQRPSSRSSPIAPKDAKKEEKNVKTTRRQNEQVLGPSSVSSNTDSASQEMAKRRKNQLSKFSKNNLLRTPAPAVFSADRINHTTEPSVTKDMKTDVTSEKKTSVTWGTGYTLESSKMVHSNEPIAPLPPVPTNESESKSTNGGEEVDKKAQAFSGKGAMLGGDSTGPPANEKPWVAAARERHAKYAKEKAEEDRIKKEKEEKIRKETERRCREIAEAMSEEEKKKMARKAELEAEKRKIENQLDDRLIRDREMKRKKQEKRDRLKLERANLEASMNQQVEDLEALALAHAVQQSVESQNKNIKKNNGSDVEDAMINAALMESAKSNKSSSNSSGSMFDDLLSSASDEVRAEKQPRVPTKKKDKRMTPPDVSKKRGISRGRSSNDSGLLNKYEKQLEFLREMGFQNAIEASTALEASGGDVQRAVELLTGKFKSSLKCTPFNEMFCDIFFSFNSFSFQVVVHQKPSDLLLMLQKAVDHQAVVEHQLWIDNVI
jgi:ubiquitin fusion degradation protein 1